VLSVNRGKTGLMAILAVTLVSACGGSSNDQAAQFKTGYESAANQLKQVSIDIAKEIEQAPGQSDAQVATVFHSLATRWQSHLSQLQTLKPPADLAAEFNTVVGAASRAETDLNAIVAAGRTHSASAAKQAAAVLVGDVVAAKAASKKITNKLGSG
jgi:hypothetical protein